MLTPAELTRYGRQLVLPEVGIAGQERLRSARVLVVGAGGLGSPAALYLAAAGVGVLGVVDNDSVELSNLHRQILHGTRDVGQRKTLSASESLERVNPNVHVRAHQERLTEQRAKSLFPEYDLIVDGSDNYQTRYAVNDACVRLGKVWIYGSVERFSGQVSVFGAQDSPCYRCIFPEAPAPESTASCEEIGVLGAVPGVVGSLQAVEALKCILGIGEPLIGRLLQLDFKAVETRIIHFERRADCATCRSRPTSDVSGAASESFATIQETDIDPVELAARLGGSDTPQLVDVREPWEWSVGRIGDPQLLQIGNLEREVETLDQGRELIVYCHHGARSSVAAAWLRARGFRARNLSGGIDRWSREVDPSVPRY